MEGLLEGFLWRWGTSRALCLGKWHFSKASPQLVILLRAILATGRVDWGPDRDLARGRTWLQREVTAPTRPSLPVFQ